MILLGIDPGYERLGWGCIEVTGPSLRFRACGLITTPKGNSDFSRLTELSAKLVAILEQQVPDQVAIETLFFSKNQTTALLVAQARGTVLSTIGHWNPMCTVRDFNPMQIKSAVTGHGGSDKKAVEKMVRLQLPGVPDTMIDDTLDALAVAMTAAFKAF